jgi:hypothetical protein
LAASIIAVTVYIVLRQPQVFVRFAIAGAAWFGAFIAYSRYVFGETIPPYYQQYGVRRGAALLDAVECNLFSPARGLLFYVPVLLLVVYLLVRHQRWIRQSMFWLGASAIGAHVVIVSAMVGCHGGHCYGPRLMTDIVPWCALLGIVAVEARLRFQQQSAEWASRLRRKIEIGVAVILLSCSVAFNASGALWVGGSQWNLSPRNIDDDLSRVWEWRHPQFLGAPKPSDR